jgi:cyclopropane fatty-acyl-phospholipid synthase-like methyltransferase
MSSSTEFWARNQVGGPYKNIIESAQALRARLRMYPTLLDLMPVNHPGKTVLDFGCGPGHDTILLAQLGAEVHYTDISPLAEQITSDRLKMHGLTAKRVPRYSPYDHIHCAGVLHHIDKPFHTLHRLSEMLKPGGEIRLMVYDGDISTQSQSEVPVTFWWTAEEMHEMAEMIGMHALHMGSYECSAEWRPNCWAACYRLWH